MVSGSRTRPPATVSAGEAVRSTNASRAGTQTGGAQCSWASAVSPGCSSSRSSRRRRASTSSVPNSRRRRAPVRSGAAPATARTCTDSQAAGVSRPPLVRAEPRGTAASSVPRRLTATRWPGSAAATGAPCTCKPRTRTVSPRRAGHQFAACGERAAAQRAGDDRAVAGEGERAVDREVGEAVIVRRPRGRRARLPIASRSAPSPAPVRAEVEHRRAGLPARGGGKRDCLPPDRFGPVRRHQVRLADGDHGMAQAEQPGDVDMLHRLRLDPLRRRRRPAARRRCPWRRRSWCGRTVRGPACRSGRPRRRAAPDARSRVRWRCRGAAPPPAGRFPCR